jgi:hypothetical protein
MLTNSLRRTTSRSNRFFDRTLRLHAAAISKVRWVTV